MTTESLWQEVSVAALLGTQRRPFDPSAGAGALDPLLYEDARDVPPGASPDASAQAENTPGAPSAERLLLRAAALASLHRRAGRLPPLKSITLPPPAPDEEWPRCSFQAGRILRQILDGRLALLPEWIETAAAAHQRVPEEHLPALLDQHKALQSLRRVALPVLGARGRWLAVQNPDWSAHASSTGAFASSSGALTSTSGALASTNFDQAWTEGSRQERLAYLEDLRARDPAAARDLLAAAWTGEAPAERLAFLRILAGGLSLADEPFLESILDDRRKDVRQAAAGLLGRLPDSGLAQRMLARACVLVRWKAGLLRSTIDVALPENIDPSMLRDGVDPRPPAGSSFGEKAWCFIQILSCVPPGAWCSAWNKRPQQILDTVRKHEWEAALLEGWQEAALRAHDAEWLEALVNHAYRNGEQKRLMDLFPRLPAAVKERLIISLLRDYPSLSYDQNASIFLSTCRPPWSPALPQSVAAVICHALQKGDLQPWRWEKLLRDIPPFFHPGLLEPSIERIAAALKKKEGGDPFVDNLLAALEFRLEMHRAFNQP